MRRLLALLILAGATASAAACATSSDPSIPAASGSPSASASTGSGSLTAFVNCARQHGVTLPDPNSSSFWSSFDAQKAANSAGWQAAWQACRHLFPPPPAAGANQLPTAQQLEQLRTFAVCMRAHGIDMSDPTPTGDMRIGGRLEHVTRAQLDNDPGFKAAQAACKNKLPGGWLGGKKKNR